MTDIASKPETLLTPPTHTLCLPEYCVLPGQVIFPDFELGASLSQSSDAVLRGGYEDSQWRFAGEYWQPGVILDWSDAKLDIGGSRWNGFSRTAVEPKS
jgi:hypothetical protein